MITDEYNSIRSEIHSCIETQNKISFFSLTIFITLTTAAIQFNSPLLTLLCCFSLINLAAKAAHYRHNVSKLATYLITFIESQDNELNWETMNFQYYKETSNTRSFRRSIINFGRSANFLIEAGFSLAFFLLLSHNNELPSQLYSIILHLEIFSVFIIAFLTLNNKYILGGRDSEITIWNQIKERQKATTSQPNTLLKENQD